MRFATLRGRGDFLKLWAGQTVSLLGSEVSLLAIPLAAALTLGATPAQMGVLAAAARLPYLLIGLFAGVWVDRWRRRPILIAAELGRASLIGSIPGVTVLNGLTVEYLYVVVFLVGVLTVFFDIAYQSFLPSLVPRGRLVEGNSRLETSRSTAQIAGPGLAGWLIGLIGAPIALIVDTLSFLVSACFLSLIRAPEPSPSSVTRHRGFREEIGDGLRVVFDSGILRGIAGCTATLNFFDALQLAVFILYATDDLGLGPEALGLVFAIGNVGLLLGAFAAGWATRRLGPGAAIIAAAALVSVSRMLVPLATGPTAFEVLVVAQLVLAVGRMVYNIGHLSLRQAITPDPLLGRVNATMRFLAWGVVPVGALIGGVLGETIGLRPTLVVGGIGSLFALGWIAFSPLWTLRSRGSEESESNLGPDVDV
jgi:MFS family permease